MLTLEQARHQFGESLRGSCNLKSEALVRAFATVPRERHLGPGPWKLSQGITKRWTTTDSDPRQLYFDVLVSIDPTRSLNNGQPSLWATLFDRIDVEAGDRVIHVGCGTGYYSAILAEIVGLAGHVIAIDVDADLAERSRANLVSYDQVEVISGDGGEIAAGPADVIVVNAGATHIRGAWLDALAPDGRLLVPLTSSFDASGMGFGGMLLIHAVETGWTAAFVSTVGIYPCIGSRNQQAEEKLRGALGSNLSGMSGVESLRRDPHEETESCWLHADACCISKAPPRPPLLH